MADSIQKWNRIIVFKYSNQIQTNFQLFIIKLILIITLSIDLSSCKPYSHRDIGSKTSLSKSFINLTRSEIFLNDEIGSDNKDQNNKFVSGIRAEGDSKRVYIDSDGISVIPADQLTPLRLYGRNLNKNMSIRFTDDHHLSSENHPPEGSDCDGTTAPFTTGSPDGDSVVVYVKLKANDGNSVYFLCLKTTTDKNYHYQGFANFMQVRAEGRMMPIYLQIFLILLLLTMSGLFSGLNLGLMALDKNELQVIASCGTEQEKRYANAISPVRKRGNYLLCSLLLGNVLVNTTLTILLDDLTSGPVAIIGSTLSIVTFGEIVPQAVCSRHGLAVGARTVWLTYIFMIATFPLSYPISKILDKVLGEEIGNVYDRERLMEYIKITQDYNRLEADEMNIISGALRIKKIKVSDIMTKIEDVFMLPVTAKLDFETVNQINVSGYSRIPIYDGDRNNVVGILHAKDLAFVDTEDKIPVKTHIEFYKHPLYFVYEDVTLDLMLNEFKQGKSHMAFVRKISDDGINDPVYKLTGIVTLEDVIEEVIQAEIVDETDIITDNRAKKKRKEATARRDFSDFVRLGTGHGPDQEGIFITPQLALATFRYLSTSVKPFTSTYLSENVLRRLMAQKLYFEVKMDPIYITDNDPTKSAKIPTNAQLYTAGVTTDYFIMILEGKVRVIAGKEQLSFDSGPFTYFGVNALTISPEEMEKEIENGPTPTPTTKPETLKSKSDSRSNSRSNSQLDLSIVNFIPDYTVICIETTTYLKVPRIIYKKAVRATIVERRRDSQHIGTDNEEEILLL